MPGILPMKVIKVGSDTPARIAQACDRCRSKKIRCDGFRPCCSQCANVGFECKTSDKLSRRAFPRGYTESLEERVRVLETEIRELKDLLDEKDEKIDWLQKIRPGSSSRQDSQLSSMSGGETKAATLSDNASSITSEQPPSSQAVDKDVEPQSPGDSTCRPLVETLCQRAIRSGRSCAAVSPTEIFKLFRKPASKTPMISNDCPAPPRLVADQMINIFFQEWMPLFPILDRQTFLSHYEAYMSDTDQRPSPAARIQLNLVFGIAALSNQKRVKFESAITEHHWLETLDTSINQSTVDNLQCYLLAQIFCLQLGDYSRANHYRVQGAGMALRLCLNQAQDRLSLDATVRETRKKVFWAFYCLDRFTAAVTGMDPSFNENDIHCELPTDVGEEAGPPHKLGSKLSALSKNMSSTSELVKASKVLDKVLKQLYPTSETREAGFRQLDRLSEELDAWMADLPDYLRLEFANDKPATTTITSQSPLITLIYYFIRTLIHRPAACSFDSDRSSHSTLILAAASKRVIQILQLLEERNLSFSMCLNRNELITACGCSLLLHTLELDRDSLLLKDYQRTTCSAIDMLQRAHAPGAPEFRRLACSLIAVRPNSTSRTSVDIATSPSNASDIFEAPDTTKHLTNSIVTPPPLATKVSRHRFRSIAPSTNHQPAPVSPTEAASIIPAAQSRRRPSTAARINLDYFTFPSDADPSKARPLALSSTSSEQSPPTDAEWPSLNDFFSPLEATHASSIEPSAREREPESELLSAASDPNPEDQGYGWTADSLAGLPGSFWEDEDAVTAFKGEG